MAKFSCEIKKPLVLGADPSFLFKKNVYAKDTPYNGTLKSIVLY